MPIIVLLVGVAALLALLLWRGDASSAAGAPRGPAGQPAAGPFDYQARPALAPEAELFYLRLRKPWRRPSTSGPARP